MSIKQVHKPWTDSEITTLVALRSTNTAAEISGHLGRSIGSVKSQLHELGVTTGGKSGGYSPPWTDADDAALTELRPTCTLAQIGMYLGRTTAAVIRRQDQLRRNGVDIPTSWQKKNPHFMPRSRAILVAKTCSACGQFLEAANFSYSSGAYASVCRGCTKERYLLKHGNFQRNENTELLQEITYAQASNERLRYTEDELLTLKDLTKSDFEVALTLGRSFYAIQNKRSKSGFVSRKRPRHMKGEWIIHFPEAQVAIREHFRKLGRPVPEEFWDW